MKRSRTWSRSFLAMTVAAILVIGLVGGAIAAAISPQDRERPLVPESSGLLGMGVADEPPPRREWLDPWLSNPGTEFADVLEALPWLLARPAVGGAEGLVTSLERSLEVASQRQLAVRLVRALSGDRAEAMELGARARASNPGPYENFAFGVALPASEAAGAAFEREAELHGSHQARRRALDTYVALGSDAALSRLLADPNYEAVADARIPYRLAERRLDWVGLFIWTGPAQHARTTPPFILLGVLSGLVWLIILAYLGDVRSLLSSRLALCLVGIVLGAASTIPTLVLSVWMEEVLGVRSADSLREGLAFYIGSVGLREELCKLLAFLPLAPIVIRRGDPREALIVAGCVGLGFAAEENVGYFAMSGGGDVAGRFLTANFGHALATGLIGAALCRALKEPKRVQDFLLIFIALVIGHGVYDALIILPGLSDWSGLGGFIYVAAALFYFGELAKCPRVERRRVPVTAVFVYGLATVLAASVVVTSWDLGFELALKAIVPGTIGAALFVFVFLRQMDEPLLP